MIIKSTEYILAPAPDLNQNSTVEKNADDSMFNPLMFDANSASMILSAFQCSGSEEVEKVDSTTDGMSIGNGEVCSTTASVKFMITMQDEQDLLSLGYNQEQIDKLKPQEVADILKTSGVAGIR